jgi:hypothetical protein
VLVLTSGLADHERYVLSVEQVEPSSKSPRQTGERGQWFSSLAAAA